MKEDINRFIGMVLDNKYEIKQLLGKGGTGNVFKGTHLYMQIPVAIKLLHPHLVTDQTAVKRFHQEAKLALSIKHDNAVSMMDFGVINGEILYLVMEFIDGVSLSYLLKQEKAMDISRAVKLMKQVCQAVDVAHRKDIVHRDLKPGNIMIVDCDQPKEMAKVIDFSIAKLSSGKGQDLTGQGIVIGTPEYVSPEQIEGSDLDGRSDLYSLGVVFYQMVTGELPFQGKSAMSLFMKHIHSSPTPPTTLRPEIPAQLEAVIMRALSKKADQRQSNALELASELEAAIVDFASVGTNSSRPIDKDAKETDIPTIMVDTGQSKKNTKSGIGEDPKQKITGEKPKQTTGEKPRQSVPPLNNDMTQEYETPMEVRLTRQKQEQAKNLATSSPETIKPSLPTQTNLEDSKSTNDKEPKSFWQKILSLLSGFWQKKE